MVIGLTLFAGYHYGVVEDSTDRSIDRPALDAVYDHTTDRGRFNSGESLGATLEPRHLPRGHNIYIEIRYRNNIGEQEIIDQAYFDGDGNYLGTTPDYRFPPNAENASRPLVVERPDGRTHGGRLQVTVWE